MSEQSPITEHAAMADNPQTATDEQGDDWPPFGRLLTDTGELSPFDPPLYWPEITAEDAGAHWEALWEWVARLSERFELDFRTLPACWYRHNALVEALVALRDHERACYAETASLSAGLDWHRALRDIEARLREWTSRTGCLSRHVPRREIPTSVTDDEWASFVETDISARRMRAVDVALADPRC